MRKGKCKICGRDLQRNNIHGYCKNHLVEARKAYYHTHKDEILKRQHKQRRDNTCKRRFGFIPKVWVHNKGITSDGCFYGNARILDTYKPGWIYNKNTKNTKMMWLYSCKGELFKIQIINPITQEEFWFREYNYNKAKRLFDNLKRMNIKHVGKWEMEAK